MIAKQQAAGKDLEVEAASWPPGVLETEDRPFTSLGTRVGTSDKFMDSNRAVVIRESTSLEEIFTV